MTPQLATHTRPHHAPLTTLEEVTRYFTPEPTFFSSLMAYRKLAFVDCGTGLGNLPVEMSNRGFDCLGVDRAKLSGQQKDVLIRDALELNYTSAMGVLLCRPSHGGWALSVARRALTKGATVFYVGLRRNYAQDIGPLTSYVVDKHVRIGMQFETMWIFKQS